MEDTFLVERRARARGRLGWLLATWALLLAPVHLAMVVGGLLSAGFCEDAKPYEECREQRSATIVVAWMVGAVLVACLVVGLVLVVRDLRVAPPLVAPAHGAIVPRTAIAGIVLAGVCAVTTVVTVGLQGPDGIPGALLTSVPLGVLATVQGLRARAMVRWSRGNMRDPGLTRWALASGVLAALPVLALIDQQL